MQIHEAQFPSRLQGKVLFLCHRNADPDAIGSAFALQQAFGGAIGVVEGMGRAGERLAQAIGARPLIDPNLDDYDTVVLVDTASPAQLSRIPQRYGLVDHHQEAGLLDDAEFYIHRTLDSTAEIVWSILQKTGREIGREMALGLMVGIISDTGRFKHAGPQAFLAAGEILERTGIEYEEALEVLTRMPSDRSQRIAVLKAASRAQIEWVEDWIVATTEVNAFEGSAAMALVNLGADVAFAAGRHGKACRISGRARRAAALAGADLSDIMGTVARTFGGSGGGHMGAAALEAKARSEELLIQCKKAALERLGGRASPIGPSCTSQQPSSAPRSPEADLRTDM